MGMLHLVGRGGIYVSTEVCSLVREWVADRVSRDVVVRDTALKTSSLRVGEGLQSTWSRDVCYIPKYPKC